MKKEELLSHLKNNPFVLAPMAGITDHPFRSFMRKRGAGIVITELISATGLEYKSERTIKLMSFDETQRPVGIQIFGGEPEHMSSAAKMAEATGCDFIDINFGCPVPKVVKKGAGSAALKDLDHLTKIVRSVVSAVQIPVTIKIRTGWDSNSRNADEVVKIAYNEGVTWVSIHGRTRAQSYSGLSDWDYIAQIKSNSKVPVLGNGDILTPAQAVERLKTSGCDGVLIGRGALKNPYIFAQANFLLRNNKFEEGQLSYHSIYNELYETLSQHCDERILQIQLKKFAAWFATGYPNASQFRKTIFQTKTTEEILGSARDYFTNINVTNQQDTSGDGFLMGGHG